MNKRKLWLWGRFRLNIMLGQNGYSQVFAFPFKKSSYPPNITEYFGWASVTHNDARQSEVGLKLYAAMTWGS